MLSPNDFLILFFPTPINFLRAHVDQIPRRLLNFVSAVNSTFIDFGSVSFSWVHREVNLAVHELAKWSHD